MKFTSLLLLILLVVISASAGSQPPGPAAPQAPIVGIWRAQMDGFPAFVLNVTDESGSLSGAVLFYLLRRDEGKPETSTPGIPEPIFNPKFDGKTLTFQVSHRRAHPPATLADSPVIFRLVLTGADKGELIKGSDAGRGLEVVRTAY